MTTVKDQQRMFYDAHTKIAAKNTAFMDLVNHPTNPLTRDDLEKLIARHPERYSRFSGFLETVNTPAHHAAHR